MIEDTNYSRAFLLAIGLHIFLGILLFVEFHNPRPTLVNEVKNESGTLLPTEQEAKIVKATTIDNQEVMAAVNRLKEERANKERMEQAQRQRLVQQAEMARQQRIAEQKKLAKLKDDAQKLALARKKQLEEEQTRLKQLAVQKEVQEKQLEVLKNKQRQLEQQHEAERLAEIKKKQSEQDRERKIRAEQLAAEDALRKAKIAGEVDKYKALIINAISRQWILPDNADKTLFSRFRIRLAPGGAVLDVNLIKSSGDAILDRSAQTAIYKASPLPVPTDPTIFNIFRDISLTVRPESARG